MITLPITEKAKKHEWKNILTIAQKNSFPKNIIHDIKKKEIAKKKNKQIMNDVTDLRKLCNISVKVIFVEYMLTKSRISNQYVSKIMKI